MNKVRVSAVSYTNTRPFVYGIQHSGILEKIDLSLDIPFECAGKLINDEADIGLIPVAALLLLPEYYIVSDYCIGANGAVDSVFIFSEKPINEIRAICLDKQSRTSNGLAKVLLKHYWNSAPEIVDEGQAFDAFVEIGDRTFGKKDKYPFVYDLALEWKKFTGLPFVFAAWTANKPLPDVFLSEFNAALQYGLEHKEQVIRTLPVRDDFDFRDYLTNKLDFNLTDDKKAALAKYLELLKTV
ncbi:MAG TPA: menaquinone biosynthesis protein [Sphingobacteriaceae bacterium]